MYIYIYIYIYIYALRMLCAQVLDEAERVQKQAREATALLPPRY